MGVRPKVTDKTLYLLTIFLVLSDVFQRIRGTCCGHFDYKQKFKLIVNKQYPILLFYHPAQQGARIFLLSVFFSFRQWTQYCVSEHKKNVV